MMPAHSKSATPSSTSIHSFFTPKPQLTSCPACNIKISLRDINKHLDEECRGPQQENEDVVQVEDDDPFADDDDDTFRRVDTSQLLNPTKKKDDEPFSRPSSQPTVPSDPLFSPPRPISSSQDSSPRFRASRQLSNLPSRFGGRQRLEASAEGSVVFSSPSPKKRKVSPMPGRVTVSPRAKRKLEGEGDSPNSKHVPFTQVRFASRDT